MPTYTFRCQACADDTERLVPISDRDNYIECECGGALKRKIDAPGAVYSPTSRNGGMAT